MTDWRRARIVAFDTETTASSPGTATASWSSAPVVIEVDDELRAEAPSSATDGSSIRA
jgi:hypothetical protein